MLKSKSFMTVTLLAIAAFSANAGWELSAEDEKMIESLGKVTLAVPAAVLELMTDEQKRKVRDQESNLATKRVAAYISLVRSLWQLDKIRTL